MNADAGPPPRLMADFPALWAVFFLQGMTPGFWMPALTNILKAHGLGGWVAIVFCVLPLCGIISPLIGGALADQRMAAERLYGWAAILGSAALLAAFTALGRGMHPAWFVGLLGAYALFSGPSWGLLTTIALAHLPNGERQFPLVRTSATIGWVVGGLLTSYVLQADTSEVAGYASAASRLVGGLIAFWLPPTPPLGHGSSWRSRLGLDAFSLLEHQDQRVFFGVTALFSIPLAAFYIYAPEMLRTLGDERATGTMTLAQVTEVAAMLVVGSVMVRYRVKTVLLWALGLSVVRFGMSAYAGWTGVVGWHIGGIMLHGMCYTFYFITAQVFVDRRVEPGLRGQAQGLLVLFSAGVGPLIGAAFCGWLRHRVVTPDGQGWMEFWAILAAMIAVCFVLFAVFYRGLPRGELGHARTPPTP